MPRILISTSSFDVAASRELQALADHGLEIVVNPHGRRLTEDEIAMLLGPKVVGLIAGVEPLTRRVLEGAPALKVISRCGIGMDSVDLAAASELGISVFNTPEAPASAVAELTLALMLTMLRRVSEADRSLHEGRWKPLMGSLLEAQTVGLVGYGRIGRRLAKLLSGFGCPLLAHDPAATEAAGVELCGLDELLARADVVSLHLPYYAATHHLLDAQRIGSMKKGAFIVNAARGGLVDEDALLAALKSGRIAGAALDTFEREPYSGPLAGLPQVVMSAHMGSYARESRVRMEQEAAANLVRGLAQQGVLPASWAQE